MVLYKRNDIWGVVEGTVLLGFIRMDPFSQVAEVALYTKDKAQQKLIKQLALSHGMNFVRNRRSSNFLLTAQVVNDELTNADSDRLMNFDTIREDVKLLVDGELEKNLSSFTTIIYARYFTHLHVLRAVRRRLLKTIGLHLKCKIEHLALGVYLTITRTDGGLFRFWNHVSPSNHPLYIMPGYHRSLTNRQQLMMINGDTDSCIGQHDSGIDYLYCPTEARVGCCSFSSWSHVNHPYKAEGKSFTIMVSATKCLSQEGADALYELIRAATDESEKYIVISGGFCSPYPHPANMDRLRPGIIKPRGYRNGSIDVRGSEGDCYWQFVTLQKEGMLEKSEVPKWFYAERWDKVYEGYKPIF